MPYKQANSVTEWITLNIVNGIYFLQEWLILNIGVGAGMEELNIVESTKMGNYIKWGIGITIIVFNVLRIIKYIIEIKKGR